MALWDYPICKKCNSMHSPHAACNLVDDRDVVPLKKQIVRVVTKQGWWFDFPKPDDFNLVNYVMSIKAGGCILNDALWQPIEGIATIFIYAEDKPPKDQGMVLPFPGTPA